MSFTTTTTTNGIFVQAQQTAKTVRHMVSWATCPLPKLTDEQGSSLHLPEKFPQSITNVPTTWEPPTIWDSHSLGHAATAVLLRIHLRFRDHTGADLSPATSQSILEQLYLTVSCGRLGNIVACPAQLIMDPLMPILVEPGAQLRLGFTFLGEASIDDEYLATMQGLDALGQAARVTAFLHWQMAT